ncbi:MAG: hypothetical protein U1A05_04775 [Alphaproteobacteria bacterium]|nr:hypothetical protein [Alphaproteobacteria bacterium]
MSNALDPAVKQRDVKTCLKAIGYTMPRGQYRLKTTHTIDAPWLDHGVQKTVSCAS